MSWIRAVLFVAATLAFGSAAWAEPRVALLIGNSAYPGRPHQLGVWDALPNAANDVKLVGEALRRDGFDVETLPADAKYSDIKAAIDRFAVKAGDSDMAVLYYAGHGFEYGRHNYLAPVDAPVAVSASDLPRRFIDVDAMVNAVGQAKMSVFFLDACRSSVTFVHVSSAEAGALLKANTIDDVQRPDGAALAVLYSAARGRKALDAAPPPADYSPFAWAVAHDIVIPNVGIPDVFATITSDVHDRTKGFGKHQQTPYTDAALFPGHYFSVEAAQAVAAPPPAPGLPPAAGLKLDTAILGVTDEPVVVARVLRDHPWREIQQLASAGDSTAAYIFGYMNEFGEGVPQNLVLARGWLERAAKALTPWGELEYGYFLYNHGESDAERDRGISQVQLAADQDYPKAKAHLAEMLAARAANPRYVSYYGHPDAAAINAALYDQSAKDYRRAKDLYAQAAKAGYPEAMEALALHGDPPDRPHWRAELRALADRGDPAGNEWLCEIEALEGDAAAVLADCPVAAEAGYVIAAARLAIAYHDGRGAPKSDSDARHWALIALAHRDLPDGLRQTLQGYHYRHDTTAG